VELCRQVNKLWEVELIEQDSSSPRLLMVTINRTTSGSSHSTVAEGATKVTTIVSQQTLSTLREPILTIKMCPLDINDGTNLVPRKFFITISIFS
jgi:hypothetical protein